MQSTSIFVLKQLKTLCLYKLYSVVRYVGTCKHNLHYKSNRSDVIWVPELLGIRQYATQNVSVTSTMKRKNQVSNISDLKMYIEDGRQFYLKLLTNIFDTIDFATVSNEDARLLLECCGKSVVNSSHIIRNDVCQKIYQKLIDNNKLDLNIYHTYIKVCTENGVLVNCTEFLAALKCEPNQETYKLLLDNICERGNIEQARKILEIMKDNSISADEEIFNKLVLGYATHDGLKSGESVLVTMRMARVDKTTDTKFSLLKGVAKGAREKDFEDFLLKYKIQLTEEQLLELIEILGANGNVEWIPKKPIHEFNHFKGFFYSVEKICIHLVHMDKSEAAILIYKEFIKPTTDKNYGFTVLREMVHHNVDIERILSIVKQLYDETFNEFIIVNLAEVALKHRYSEASWKLLENISELRVHFFWPLLINANKKEGELGVYSALRKIINMKVQIDSETLQYYVLPFLNLDNSKFVIKRLQELGLQLKQLLGPMILSLLQSKKLTEAADLCTTYPSIPIYGDSLLNLLLSSWITSKDKTSVVLILQRYCESHPTSADSVGDYIIKTLNACKSNEDLTHFLKLLELINENKLKINPTSGDKLHDIICTKYQSSDLKEKIRDQVDGLLNFELKIDSAPIPHPKDMTIVELECHLLELQEKKMGTRGVLRKLVLMHSNLGNLQRVEELRQQFFDSGYKESVGMRSSLMHSYVQGGHLEPALKIYKEIKTIDNSFKLDEFKVIDLITLLVKENKFNEAMDILKTETSPKKIRGGTGIEKNCWKLLGSFSNEDEQLQMFHFLTQNGYCNPTNVILGPLVRLHLNRGNLAQAVDVYVNCANKYKCTPLQLELICSVSKSRQGELLQKVLNATESVHGPIATQTALIAALAENRQEKTLTKVMMDTKFSFKKYLEQRCERWIQEGKVEALHSLANVCQRLSKEIFDVNFVYNCIMQTFSLNNDCKGAVEFYETLLAKDVTVEKDLEIQLNKLLKRCNYHTKKM